MFGHIIAGTHDLAFLMPLQTVFDQLDKRAVPGIGSDARACLPPVFDVLANLAHTYHEDGLEDLALRSAASALSDEVLLMPSASQSIRYVQEFLSRRPGETARDFISHIIMGTGSDLAAGLSRLEQLQGVKTPWTQAQLQTAEGRDLLQALKTACEAEMREHTSHVQPSSTADQNVANEPLKSPLSDQESDLVKDVSSFLKSIEPWKAIMPPQLFQQMQNLEQRTQALEQNSKPEDSNEYELL